MSSTHPPTGPQGPEYLEQGSGAPIGGDDRPGIGRTRALVAGAAVAGLALVGGGVWAAMSFLGQGPQPAEALPASTLGYAAIDLDPSGGQKLEAIRMLKKFPAFEDQVDLDTDDDLRRTIFEEAGLDEACPGLSYEDDVEPWLGNRFAVAAVDLGEEEPTFAVVVQVEDPDAADAGMRGLVDCAAETGDQSGAWTFSGEWMVVAETESIAQDITDATAEASLADDADYRKWTEEVGDAGVLNLYAAPEAGAHLADAAEGFLGPGAMSSYASDCVAAPGEVGCDEFAPIEEPGSPVPDELRELLEEFGGAAATLRFDDGALELEMAGDASLTQQGLPVSDGGDDVLSTLPADTAAAFGIGFTDGWFAQWMERTAVSGMDMDGFLSQIEAETGLSLPEDVEILAGESAALAIGPDLDGDALVNSETAEGLPIGVKVQGDPEAIEDVLDELRASLGPDAELLVSQSDGDLIAIGTDEDYTAELLEGGDLGDSETFRNVVREAEDAGSIVYVNFDAGGGWLVEIAGDDAETAENLEPLEGLGISGWVEDDAGHVVLRLTTS